MIRYSIIIPFRNRHWHLSKLLPELKKVFKDKNYEIIIARQDDTKKFRKSSLLDMAVRHATGNIFVFHDVDYYPVTTNYFAHTNELDKLAYLPVKRVQFMDNNMELKHDADIPSGYRHFKNGVDDDFFGGVVMLSKKVFEQIGGFNPCFVGWGCEDADIRMRLIKHNIPYIRGDGSYFALDHKDSNPGNDDVDFIQNNQLLMDSDKYMNYGTHNLSADVVAHPTASGAPPMLYINNFKVDLKNGIQN